MKLDGTPFGYLFINEVAEILGSSSRNLRSAGLLEILDYYWLGRTIYTKGSVAKMAYWLKYRQACLAFGQLYEKSPLRPPLLPEDVDVDLSPEADAKSRQMFLNAWYDEDVFGDVCPTCDGDAFANGELGDHAKIWCPNCGILDQNNNIWVCKPGSNSKDYVTAASAMLGCSIHCFHYSIRPGSLCACGKRV